MNLATFFILLLPLGIPQHIFSIYFILSCFFIILSTFFILLLPLGISQHNFSICFILSCYSSTSLYSSYQSCHQVYPNTSFLSIFFVLLFIKLATFCIILLPLGISQHIFSINFILSCYSSTSPHSSYQSCHQVYPITSFLPILFCLVIHQPRHILHTTPATRFIPSHLFYQFYFVLLFINLATFCILLLPLGLSHHIFSINFIVIHHCLVIHHSPHVLHTTPATRYIPTHLFYQFYFVLLFIILSTFFILLLPLGISQHNFSFCFFCLVIHQPRHILHTTPATRFNPSHLFYQFYFFLLFTILPTFFILLLPLDIFQHIFSINFILSCYSSSSPHSSNYSCHQVYPNTTFLSILFCLVIHHLLHILHTTPATRYTSPHSSNYTRYIFSIYFILSCYSSTSPYSSYYSCHQLYPNKSVPSILICHTFHHPRHMLHTSPATRYIPTHLFYQFYFVLLFINLATFCILLLPLGISQHIFSINFILSCYSSTSPHSSYYSCHQVYPITSFLSILFCLVIHQPRHILHTTPATRFIPSHLFYQFYFVLLFINLSTPLHILHTTPATRFIPSHFFYQFYFVLLFTILPTFFILLLPLGLSHHNFSINFILSCYSPSSPHSSYYSCHQDYSITSFLSILFCLVIYHPPHILHTTPATRFIPSHLFYQFFFVLLFTILPTFLKLLLRLDISQHIFSINFILSCYSSTSPHSSYQSCHQVYPITSFLSI